MGHAMKMGRFAFPGRKDTIKACGYVEDIVRSFRFMLDLNAPSVTHNLAHWERYTSEEIGRALAEVLGIRRQPPVVPLRVMNFAAFGFEVLRRLGLQTGINRARIDKLNRSTNIMSQALMNAGFTHEFALPDTLAKWHAMSSSSVFD